MIDLSAIDKVEDRPAGGNRKATRFAPRARTRAPPKPAAKSQVPDPQEAEHDETPANKTTEENEAKSDGETRQGDNTNQAQASPDAKKSKITDQDTNTEPDSEQEVVPQDTGTHKSDAAPLQDESQKKQADDSTDQPKDKEPQSKEAIQNPEDVIPDPKIVEEMSEKLAKNKQPVPARPAYELPARVKRKLRSQAKIRNEDRSENDSEQDRRDSMAIVPVEDPQDGGTENMELQTTKASGKGRKKRDIETEAHMELDPAQDPIKKYMRRADAQERLHKAQVKKKKADAIENGEQDDEEDEDQGRAIVAREEANAIFAPQLELVDGKFVPKMQSMTIQAQAEPVHRRVREYNNVVNNASYTNKMSNERWSAADTEAFFNAIGVFGTNFELIAKVFPGRPRKALANKWRRESKLNPERIEAAFTGKGGFEALEKMVEAMQQTETTANGDVGDLGIHAKDFFEAEAEPLAIEAAKPAEKSNSVKKTRKRKANEGTANDSQTKTDEVDAIKSAKATGKRGRPKKTESQATKQTQPRRNTKKAGAKSLEPASDLDSDNEIVPSPKQKRQRSARGSARAENFNVSQLDNRGPGKTESALLKVVNGAEERKAVHGDIDAADAEGAEGLLHMASGVGFHEEREENTEENEENTGEIIENTNVPLKSQNSAEPDEDTNQPEVEVPEIRSRGQQKKRGLETTDATPSGLDFALPLHRKKRVKTSNAPLI